MIWKCPQCKEKLPTKGFVWKHRYTSWKEIYEDKRDDYPYYCDSCVTDNREDNM